MQQYKKSQTISRLKMAYSILDNMTQQSYVENGFPPVGLQFHVTNEIFDTYFGKYLSIAKDCGMATSLAELKDTGCFKSGNYRKYGESDFAQDGDGNKLERDMFYTLDGVDVTAGYGPSYYYKVLLKNGMSLGVWNHVSNTSGYVFAVDIDGPNRGESKLGQDVFQFTYYAPNQGIRGTGCQYTGLFKGAYNPNTVKKGTCDVTREQLLSMCSVGGDANGVLMNGSGCSGLIIKDGWKISKDYPWDYAQKKIK